MTNPWNTKGCEYCRGIWERAEQRLPELGVDFDEHTSLHRCPKCGSYWEVHERFVDVVSEDGARAKYPQSFAQMAST